ncbi:MAG: hypothetical protein RLZZ09_714 [Pseudomonadota bacterium]
MRPRCSTLAVYFRDPVNRVRGSARVDLLHRLPMGCYRQCRWGPKDLPDDWRARSEAKARELVTRWARVMLFMDRTGLRPSVAWRTLFREGSGTPLPGMGRALVWLDEEGRYLVTTEPEGEADRAQLLMAASAADWTHVAVEGFSLWGESANGLCILAPPKRGGDVDAVRQALTAKLKVTERFEFQVSRGTLEGDPTIDQRASEQ